MRHRLFLPATAALALALAIPATAKAGMGGGGGGHGIGLGLDGGHAGLGLGASRGALGLGRGFGSARGGDDIHLGLSSRELGLGNNFGLDAPDNVLSRAARVGTPPIIPSLARRADDRPSLKGLDLGMAQDAKPSSHGQGTQADDDRAKGNNLKKDERQAGRFAALEEQEQLLEQSQLAQLENELSATMPPVPSPPSPATTATIPTNSPPAPTLPEVSLP